MSMYIEFEPHSWYKGFAIEKPEHNDPENYSKYYAYTDDGMTYRIVEKQADTLKQLKQQITEYRTREAKKISELYKNLERTAK